LLFAPCTNILTYLLNVADPQPAGLHISVPQTDRVMTERVSVLGLSAIAEHLVLLNFGLVTLEASADYSVRPNLSDTAHVCRYRSGHVQEVFVINRSLRKRVFGSCRSEILHRARVKPE